MSLGERITELRKAAGMSQYELASSMEVSRQAVSKWENGQSLPDAANLIRLADILESDVEFIATGRKSYGRRPPIVIKSTETVEKIVEKPVIQVVEKVVERVVPSPPVVQTIEKPVIKRVYRTKYVNNPVILISVGVLCFLLGIAVGIFL